MERLQAVFERLQEHNLKLKPSKCELFKERVSYLGHVVSEEGIHTDLAKIEAVKSWPVPKNIKDIRRFLGFTGCYRKFNSGICRNRNTSELPPSRARGKSKSQEEAK